MPGGQCTLLGRCTRLQHSIVGQRFAVAVPRVHVSRITIGCYGILRLLVRVRWVPMGIRKPLLLTIALLVPAKLLAAEALPRTILFLDQSETRGPFYQEVYSGFRDAVNADLDSHVTVYRESLDLSRFAGASYEQTLHDYLQEKYRDRPIGAVVAIGAGTLELVRRWRAELWQHTPVVFALVDEAYLASLPPMSGVTGGVVKLPLADAITAARAVVPTLDSVALVGDAWDRQVVFKSWKDEIASATAGFKVIELIGLTMREMRQRVAELPDRSAIIYSAVYSDGEGAFYPPATALALIAQKANRPIVVASEPSLEAGGIGGFVLLPAIIGAEAGRRALRVIQGEAASNIPVSPAEGAVKPIFNWQQMERWNVREADLPPGSLLKRTPFELKEIDVNEVVRNAFDLMLPQASTRKVALYLRTCRTPVQIKGDAIQLQQVLLNLIANGMDAMASIPSGRTIIGRTDIGKGRALISILDSGSGIPPNELKQIFDRFFTTKEQGMGVGLSIARTIVQAHKGQIWAENQREGGAVFWISLPLS